MGRQSKRVITASFATGDVGQAGATVANVSWMELHVNW
jgi:hypothetical protein